MERLVVDTSVWLAYVNRADESHVDLVRVRPSDEEDAWRLFKDRSDRSYSFTDCTSFVVMRRLGLPHATALDEDFRREGFEVVP
jgi:predicted nucleic acid-binding protein